MRFLTLVSLLLVAAAGPAAAQQAAPSGPFVTAISDDTLVLVATGPARPNGVLTYAMMEGQLVRVEVAVQANCSTNQYRTSEMDIFQTDSAGARGAFIGTVPGLEWVPFTPDDAIVRDFVCSGVVGGDTYRTPQPALAAWLDRQGY